MDINKMTKVYVRIRDARAAATKVYEDADRKLKEQLEMAGNQLLKYLQDNKIQSLRTDAGTVYTEEDLKPSASDWDALYAFIVEHNAFEALEKRIKKTFVKEYMEANDGALPPGVSVHREHVARVRRT